MAPDYDLFKDVEPKQEFRADAGPSPHDLIAAIQGSAHAGSYDLANATYNDLRAIVKTHNIPVTITVDGTEA